MRVKTGFVQSAATVPRTTNIAAAAAVPRARPLADTEAIICIRWYYTELVEVPRIL